MKKKTQQQLSKQKIQELIGVNPDARQYFFSKADVRWLEWLWKNGFLDAIKQKAGDPTRYGYRMPELNYLARVAEKKPKEVTDIMLAVPISKETFNPEVIDQFLHICSGLPAEQLARVAPKIRDERWIPLMGVFNRWGLEYEKMFQTFASVKDYKNILILAEAVLSVRTKEKIRQTSYRLSSDNPFYFNDLSYTKVFKYLVAIDDESAEQALEFTTKVMAKIVLLGEKAKSGEVFPVREIFYLFDVDFFSLEPSGKEHLSYQYDVQELAATIKVLARRLIGERCSETKPTRAIYEKYIQTLPDSRSMWRLRLFVLSLCPDVFKDELKKAFLRLFEVMEAGKSYYEIESGTEYKKSLKKSFGVLGNKYQREYIQNIFEYFGKSFEDKKEEQWYKRDGWQILSMVCKHLTDKEHKKCMEIFGKRCNPNFEPEPSIGKIKGGTVIPRGPITQEEFCKLPIIDIASKLRNEWTPDKLSKRNKSNDFLTPLNAEGVGNLIRGDIPNRLQDYIDNASLFFGRDVLDQHYTYSFLRGIQETIHDKNSSISDIKWNGLIDLFTSIKDSGEDKSFGSGSRERSYFDTWLSGWEAVHSSIADVLQELLRENGGKTIISFPKYRDQLLEIVSYLFRHPDPEPKNEELETAKSKTKSPSDKDYLVSDPFTIAINSVRGRTFQAFVMFVFQDGKKFVKKEPIKISADVKKLYEDVLRKEKTQAMMFMFGHYLPSFYYRDRKWMGTLLAKIFPKEAKKKHLYLAAWEGYLSTNLYKEIFLDSKFQKLYERGLTLADYKDPKRKYFMELDEGIATHFALAFMHYQEFGFDHSLFKTFWNITNLKRHTTFVSFIGRMFISGDNASADKLLQKEPRCKKRLKKLWDWLLENYQDSKLFIEFGFWISLKKDIFKASWLANRAKKTLEKTNGVLDWEYGLVESVGQFAKVTPKDTLEIARLYLLEGGVRKHQRYMSIHIDNEWLEVLQILYDNSTTKSETYNLINNLILEGGSIFWKLKEAIKDNGQTGKIVKTK